MTFEERFDENLGRLMGSPPAGFEVFSSGMYRDDGPHPVTAPALESGFAAACIHRVGAREILDVGSYRLFVIGLCASPFLEVTVLELRDIGQEPCGSEKRIMGDVKDVDLGVERFDAVVSLCALEHFGLGRYGEEFDLFADTKAIANVRRCLRSGGHFIFTTAVGDSAAIWYNAHRIYSLEMLQGPMSDGFEIVDEGLIVIGKPPHFRKLYDGPVGRINWYCGMWKKP